MVIECSKLVAIIITPFKCFQVFIRQTVLRLDFIILTTKPTFKIIIGGYA